MNTKYYVATDEMGVERRSVPSVRWPVPKGEDTVEPVRRPDGDGLVLHDADGLLDVLDEVIWVAEPLGEAARPVGGGIRVEAASLVHRTPWGAAAAALFALDCAEHALGDAGPLILPSGQTITVVIADARRLVTSEGGDDERLGLLARVATIRRLKRENRSIGDLALGLAVEDGGSDIDVASDASWSTAAAIGDSLLAAIEALRHVAAPRYVTAREATTVEQRTLGDPAGPGTVFVTAWGPLSLGSESLSEYVPASISAAEAASRARDAVRDRSGEAAAAAEREWQADRLTAALDEG